MNLVAKQFVAARSDKKGVLVLSEFTRAARKMTETHIINPNDIEGSAEAQAAALAMPEEEQRDQIRFMCALLSQFNVYRGAGNMIEDAAQLLSQERMAERLHDRNKQGQIA
jgi:trehalose 6-phosphate synthase